MPIIIKILLGGNMIAKDIITKIREKTKEISNGTAAIIILAILSFTLSISLLFSIYELKAMTDRDLSVSVSQEQKPLFILKAKENKIAVLTPDGNVREIIDISLITLPASDRIRLEKGIEVYSLSELGRLLQDLS